MNLSFIYSYLADRGLVPREFNSYGSRRGNDAVMARGTFANIRLLNKFIGKAGPKTIHLPSGETVIAFIQLLYCHSILYFLQMDVFDAAQRYMQENYPVIILAGKEYGSGSSRDWAAKGPYLLGIKAVIAESYERIHRSNLVGMGIMPLQYLPEENAESLGLTGKEQFTIEIPKDLHTMQKLNVKVSNKVIRPPNNRSYMNLMYFFSLIMENLSKLSQDLTQTLN